MKLEIPGYRFEHQIGKGGMALVYQAVQENFGRKVAIKILSPGMEAEKEYAERFMLEARTVATLNHPHIIPVYDVGQIGSHYYIVMEYLPGNTLKQWIASGLDPLEALDICSQVADALHYANSKGIVHRDIKPENIMFREDNSAVLTDFGIASSSKDANELTQEGCMIGTPSYMSPEQARAKPVDGRSDIYSLGVVLYEMLTREKPYQADDPMGIALAHISEPVPVLPVAVSVYQSLIDKMMAKQPEQRYANGLALNKAIKNLQRAEQNAAPVVDSGVSKAAPQDQGVENKGALQELLSSESVFADDVDTAPRPDNFALPGKNLTAEITGVRKALLFTSSQLTLTVVSDDPTQFGVQFSQVSQKILEWYQDFGKKARRLKLTFYCKPWILDPIQRSVAQLLDTPDPFGFLKKVEVSLEVYDMEGRSLLEEEAV